jgi:hypothetical protein
LKHVLQESGVCKQFIVKYQMSNWITRTAAIDYMVVAGGGGGGAGRGGGGGAGGYRASGYGPSPLQGSNQSLSLGTYAVTVGAGGAGAANQCAVGALGSVSTFGCITSAGGGYGGVGPPE